MQFRDIGDTMADEIKRNLHSNIIESERRKICKRGDRRNFTRNVHHHRVEHELYLNDIKIKNTYSNVKKNLEQEDKLAKELQNQRREEISNMKIRQQLRETSLELRELESKLRAAYITKELCAQIAEKECLTLKNKMEEKEADEIVMNALRSNNEDQIEAKELKRKMEYKKELQDQVLMKYQEKQCKYEEFLKEKKLLDEIIQRIHDEDAREIEDKMCKMKKTKEEIDTYKKSQEIWRQKERSELEKENRRIEQYLKNKEIQEREKKLQKKAADDTKEKALEEIAKRAYIEQLKRKERQEILQELIEEESKQKEDEKIKQEFQRQIQRRIELQNVLARQLEEREEKIRQEELEDIQYREQMLAKIMEDTRLEQLSADKRRRKMLELRREVEHYIKERQAKRVEEMRTLLYLQEQEKIQEENRKKLIEDERLRLLKEHASNLIGFLPPGVLRADDLPHLGSECVKYYSGK